MSVKKSTNKNQSSTTSNSNLDIPSDKRSSIQERLESQIKRNERMNVAHRVISSYCNRYPDLEEALSEAGFY